MQIHRRRPLSTSCTEEAPAPPATSSGLVRRRSVAPPSSTSLPHRHLPLASHLSAGVASDLGVKMMRRIERRDSPVEPHWYLDTTTDQEAISRIARAFKAPLTDFHVVRK